VEGHIASDSQEESSSSSPDRTIPEISFVLEGDETVITKNQLPIATVEVENDSQAQDEPFAVSEDEIDEFPDEKQTIRERLDVNVDADNNTDDSETDGLVLISQADMPQEPSSPRVEELEDQAPELNESSYAPVVKGHIESDPQEESSSSSPDRTIPEDSFESEGDETGEEEAKTKLQLNLSAKAFAFNPEAKTFTPSFGGAASAVSPQQPPSSIPNADMQMQAGGHPMQGPHYMLGVPMGQPGKLVVRHHI
jgi:hypothetical protein